jgi:hypothetical protein
MSTTRIILLRCPAMAFSLEMLRAVEASGLVEEEAASNLVSPLLWFSMQKSEPRPGIHTRDTHIESDRCRWFRKLEYL